MAANRNQFIITKGLSNTWRLQFIVASGGAATISMGTPSKSSEVDASVAGAVVPMVDGDGTVSQRFTGIAAHNSTDTASAAGIVDTWAPIAGLVYRGKPKTSGAADTQSEINLLSGKRVVFDLTSNVWTLDSAAADALVNCVVIAGGNANADELLFYYAPKGTCFDSSTAIT